MAEPKLSNLSVTRSVAGHNQTFKFAYWQWGKLTSRHVVVCAHGLSRQGRDFDVLAQALVAATPSGDIRIICPDVLGRGQSDWLGDPMGYQIPLYVADMIALLTHLHEASPISKFDWIGTSMGGLIGMVLAGQPDLPLPEPMRKLVLNDVGPVIEWTAIERIGRYLGQSGDFDSLQAAADAMWSVSTGFGPHTPAQWLELTRHMIKSVKALKNIEAAETSAVTSDRLRLHYDPAIAIPFKQSTQASTLAGEALLWKIYEQIQAQTLLLRGADSDLLTRATVLAMQARGPHAQLVEFAGVGHAPTLIADDQVAVVSRFLFDHA